MCWESQVAFCCRMTGTANELLSASTCHVEKLFWSWCMPGIYWVYGFLWNWLEAHVTCLSCRAVGAHHLSRLRNLDTAAAVRTRARLTITRCANQGVAIVAWQAVLTGHPRSEVGALAHTWNHKKEFRKGAFVRWPTCYTNKWEEESLLTSRGRSTSEQTNITVWKKIIPQKIATAHKGEQKTTAFTPAVIALGNMWTKLSQRDFSKVTPLLNGWINISKLH